MSSLSPTLEDYRGFAETVPESVLIVNSSGEVVFANSAARLAFLFADDEFYARYVYELVPAQWRAGHDQRMRSFMDHPSPPGSTPLLRKVLKRGPMAPPDAPVRPCLCMRWNIYPGHPK